jgi:hypothetical protein
MQGKCTRVYQNSDILGVIAVVLRHRRKPARENLVYCIARGRNTCDSIDYNKWILQTTTIRLFKKKGSSFGLIFLHEQQIITISEDVMNTVIKPISFLERYREEYYLHS